MIGAYSEPEVRFGIKENSKKELLLKSPLTEKLNGDTQRLRTGYMAGEFI